MARELIPFSIRNFMKGLNRRADQQDIGQDLFRDIRNFNQDEWGKLVSLAGNVASAGDTLVGEILEMEVYYPSTSGIDPHLIVMTDGNSPILASGIGKYGAEGRIYKCSLDLTTFEVVATEVTFSADPIFPARDKLVTMHQINNKLYIATGYGPVRIWSGTKFITEAGLYSPESAPVLTPINEVGGENFIVNTTFTNVIAPKHFAVIKGHENELYCASAGIGITEFVKYDRTTGARISLGSLPEIAPVNKYALVGHNDGETITYIVSKIAPSYEYRFYRYTRSTNSWTLTPVVEPYTGSSSNVLSGAVIPRNSSDCLLILQEDRWDGDTKASYDIVKFSQTASYTKLHQELLITNMVPTGYDFRGMITATDRDGDSLVYVLFNGVGTEVKLMTFNWSDNTVQGSLPGISGYLLRNEDTLLYVYGSMESRIRLIKGGSGFTLADSLYKDIESITVGTWLLNGGTYTGFMYPPFAAPGGMFYGATGNMDFALYGATDPFYLAKNFLQMQASPQSVDENIRRKYKYGYTYANDQTESALSPESTEIEVVSGRPVKVEFAVSPQGETLYRRLYRTDDYYGIGSAPPITKRLKTDRNNAEEGKRWQVKGKRWQVNDNTSTWFIDDSDIAEQASAGRPTQPDDDLLCDPPPSPSTSPPPENASIVTQSGGRMFLAGFPLNPDVPTNPSMVAFSTVEDYETFDPVAGVDSRDRSDGDSITAMVPLDQDSLAIYKVNSIHVKNGDPEYTGAFRRVSETIGCIAPRSAVAAARVHCFLSKLGVYDFDGSTPRAMSDSVNLDFDRNLADAQKIMAAGVFHDNKYMIAIPDPSVLATKNSVVFVWDFPLQCWSARNIGEVKLFTDVRGTTKNLLFAPYNEGETAGRIMQWDAGDHLAAVDSRIETGFFDMGNAYLDKIWRRLWLHLNIPIGLEVEVDWSVDDGRATGTLGPFVGTGQKEAYLVQCPRAMMGKNLKFFIAFDGIGLFEIYGIDGQAIVMPRRRGI